MYFDYIFLCVLLLVSNSLSFHLSHFFFCHHLFFHFPVSHLSLNLGLLPHFGGANSPLYERFSRDFESILYLSPIPSVTVEKSIYFFFFFLGPLCLFLSPPLCSSLLKYHDVVSWCGLFLFIVLSTGITLAIRKFMFFKLGIFSCFISLIILSFCCFCSTFWETFKKNYSVFKFFCS